MRLSFNSSAYVKYSFEEMCKNVSQFGYEAIEISRTHPVHELGKRDREELLKEIKSHGLEVSAIQGGNPYLDPEYAKKRIDLAVDLGCPVVSLGCGVLVTEEEQREKQWKEVSEHLGKLANYAMDKGIKVVIEPEPPVILAGVQGKPCERLVGTLKDVQKMLADVNAENMGVLLDIGHVYVVRENLLDVIEKLGKKIFHVHVEDIIDRIHCHFIPGTGMVDFEGAFRVLNKVGYEGCLSVELEAHVDEPDRGALESIQYLGSILYRIGLK